MARNRVHAYLAGATVHYERGVGPRRLGIVRRDDELVGGRDEGHLLEEGRHDVFFSGVCDRMGVSNWNVEGREGRSRGQRP